MSEEEWREAEAARRRESRRRLIARLNESEKLVREPEEHGRLSAEELTLEMERQHNLSRRGFGQMPGQSVRR
jgi:hypothetical protein